MCTILYVKKIVSFYLGTFKKTEPFCITSILKFNYILPKTL